MRDQSTLLGFWALTTASVPAALIILVSQRTSGVAPLTSFAALGYSMESNQTYMAISSMALVESTLSVSSMRVGGETTSL
jgi:hypothetical protein